MEWFTSHGGSQQESHGHYILECEDGGFLQVGETGYVGVSARILVVKTDSNGGLIWKRELGSGARNMGNAALEVESGYLVCGMLSRNSAIVKLDKATGATLFQETHDNGGADAFEHIALHPAGILAVGYRQAADPNSTFFAYGQGHITFLDNSGGLLGSQSVNSHLSQAYRVKPTANGFVIAGGTDDALQYGVLEIDPAGTVLWSRTYGGSSEDHCFGMDLGADGSIFLAGHTLSGTANWDTYTIKLDSDGNELWQRKRATPGASTRPSSTTRRGASRRPSTAAASSRRGPGTSTPTPRAAAACAPISGRPTSSSTTPAGASTGRRPTAARTARTGRPRTST